MQSNKIFLACLAAIGLAALTGSIIGMFASESDVPGCGIRREPNRCEQVSSNND
jgi:hypothetical protein